MTQGQLTEYVKAFSSLRTDSGKDKYPEATLHRAPHKPLLLLTVLDMAAQSSLTTNIIPLMPELADIFTTYWKLAMPPERVGNLFLPFFHLKSDGFRHLIPQHGKNEILASIRQIGSAAQLRETVLGAQLDDALFDLICVEESRNILRVAIIEKYFRADMRSLLVEQAGINLVSYQYSEELLAKTRMGQATGNLPIDDTQRPARDQGFRRAIVTAYDHRCVLCGVRLMTSDGLTVANAAHIVPWSISYNDNPRNGLCLCRLCHWVFDVGLASITSKYRIRLSKQVGLEGNVPGHLSTLDDRPIFEPVEEVFNPDIDALKWHMIQIFLR
jgi:putative restriction endonuclease